MKDTLVLILVAVSLTGIMWEGLPDIPKTICATAFLGSLFYLGMKILKNEPYFEKKPDTKKP